MFVLVIDHATIKKYSAASVAWFSLYIFLTSAYEFHNLFVQVPFPLRSMSA